MKMKAEIKYEDAVKRLKTIVSEIENGDTDIDQLADNLKEAKELIAFCKGKLQTVETEIKKILED